MHIYAPSEQFELNKSISSSHTLEANLSIAYIIIGNSAYPRQAGDTLFVGALTLPASGSVAVLTVAAGQVAVLDTIIFQATANGLASLRANSVEILRFGLMGAFATMPIAFANGFVCGNSGNDLDLFNNNATASTIYLTLIGSLITL